MTRLKILCTAAALLVLCGCVAVPKSTIAYQSPEGASIKLELPKDVELVGLMIDLSGGKPVVLLESYKARMNPEVIGNSAQGQAELIREWRGLFGEIAAAAAK